MKQTVECPVCTRGRSGHFTVVDGFDYYSCQACGSLHVAPDVLAQMDAGTSQVGKYAAEYWQQEQEAALERASGSSLSRAGEAILYCRRPVRRFLDVGSGPGYLLRGLQERLDPQAEIFHAVEKFPPSYAQRSRNYHECGVESLEGHFDAGVCIEVVEHLTPRMLDGMAAALARLSQPGSFWLFNTGMPDFVRQEDPGYLDPLRRGHVVSYSLAAARAIFGRHGFRVDLLPGKSFAFYAEMPGGAEAADFDQRIYQALPENLALLKRDGLLFQAAFESARAYLYYARCLERPRGRWPFGKRWWA